MKHLKKCGFLFLLISVFYITAMDLPSPLEKLVYIATSDNSIQPIERWKIDEMKALLVLLQDQTLPNNIHHPLQVAITLEELMLLSNALSAISVGKFADFFAQLEEEDSQYVKKGQTILSPEKGKIRTLVNVAGRMHASGVTAFCLSYIMPGEVQKSLFVQDLINQIIFMFPFAKTYLQGHINNIRIVLFSPDGTKIVSGGIGDANQQHNLILWDISNSTITPYFLNGQASAIKSVAFSPDGTHLVSASDADQDNLFLWDIRNLSAITHQILNGHPEKVRSVAFNSDGTKIISASDGDQNNLILWDISNKAQITHQALRGHQSTVVLAEFSPDDKSILSASVDNFILWNITNMQNITHQLLVGHRNLIDTAEFSRNNNNIISGSWGNQNNLILWNIHNPYAITHEILKGHAGTVTMARFNPTTTKIVSGGWGNTHNLILWDISNIPLITHQNLEGHPDNLTTVAFSADGKKIISGCSGKLNNLIVWDLSDPHNITHQVLQGHAHTIRSVAFNPDGRKIITASLGFENNLILYEMIPLSEEELLRNCSLFQAQFIYQLCLASQRGFSIQLKSPYALELFNSLPVTIQNLLKKKLSQCFSSEQTFSKKKKEGDCIVF